MFQGNWKCSSCGGPITELPFQPRSESGLTCRTCYAKSKGSQSAPAPEPEEISGASEEAPPIPDDAGVATDAPADDGFGAEAKPITPGERQMFQGDWKCSGCGATITSLPFQPRDTTGLKCIDCFKQSKGL